MHKEFQVQKDDPNQHRRVKADSKAGWSLEKTGEYLGQKSIQSTKRYAHFDETNSEEGADILTKRIYKS